MTLAPTVIFLHGILGRGQNLRGIAQRLCKEMNVNAILVDLPLHGGSQAYDGPLTLDGCVDAILRSLEHLPTHKVMGVVGHSFGGKVALKLAAHLGENPQRGHTATSPVTGVIIDSAPSAFQGTDAFVQKVFTLLRGAPETFSSRDAFYDHVIAQGYDRPFALWLGTNLQDDSSAGGVALKWNLDGIESMLNDYFSFDAWELLQWVGEHPQLMRLHWILGGASKAVSESDKKLLARLAKNHRKHIHLTHIPHAGHWVHVDAPNDLVEALKLSFQLGIP